MPKPKLSFSKVSSVRVGPVDIPVYLAPDLEVHGVSWDDPVPGIAIRSLDGVHGPWTLFHEVLHMIDFYHGFEWTEETTRSLDAALLLLFRDNPNLVSDLLRTTQGSTTQDAQAIEAAKWYIEKNTPSPDTGE